MKQSLYFKNIMLFLLIQINILFCCSNLFAQNSLTGDGFGGRSWYVAHNYLTGSYAAFAVCGTDKQLYGWGGNLLGELGNGTTTSTDIPIAIAGMNHVKFYAAGYMCAVIKDDNTLWVWGVHSSPYGGPLSGFTNAPQYVMDGVKFVNCAMNHTAIVKNDGTVWGIGQNTNGQLGNGLTSPGSSPVTTPVQMSGINNGVRAIAVGWGGSTLGSIPATIILLSDSTVKITGGYQSFTGASTYVPVTIPALHNIIDIKGGSNSAFALNSIGEVFAFGTESDQDPGSLGLGSSVGINNYKPPTKISFPEGAAPIVALSSKCDGRFSLALDENKNVYAWGANRFGQLGNGMTSNVNTPELVATNVVDIFAGETFSYILKSDNTLWCTGGSGYDDTYGSIWMNLTNQVRDTFTQIDPTAALMNLCTPGILPVTLINFDYALIGNTVNLNWSSGEEINFDKYIVQYSLDGVQFLDITTLKGKGGNKNYTFTYQQVNPVTFYRLKLMDNDGNFTYSEIRSIKIKTTNKFVLSPNPADGNMYLYSNQNVLVKSLEIISVNGRRVKIINNFSQGQAINIAMLSQGLYLLKITDTNNEIEFLKFVKK